MTTEEKAKAYDEALKKIQPLYEQAKKDDNPIWSTYEHLFPQLRESEDERVRKRIVLLVEQFAQGLNKGPMLAYLEKQKEQNPAEWSEEDEKLLDFWLDVIDRNDWRMDENFCKASREFINRLKSLRPQPHWKPSEEQISSLKQARDYYMSGRIKYVGRHLSEIAEQLEKLM